MKYSQQTFATFFFTLCFSIAIGIFLGNFSLHFLGVVVTQKNTNDSVPMSVCEEVRVPILVYHSVRPHPKKQSLYQEIYDITPKTLEKHLAYLKKQG
jgi:hypothetical protein